MTNLPPSERWAIVLMVACLLVLAAGLLAEVYLKKGALAVPQRIWLATLVVLVLWLFVVSSLR
jgi:hypothetical protein